jgi:hypothetical protein
MTFMADKPDSLPLALEKVQVLVDMIRAGPPDGRDELVTRLTAADPISARVIRLVRMAVAESTRQRERAAAHIVNRSLGKDHNVELCHWEDPIDTLHGQAAVLLCGFIAAALHYPAPQVVGMLARELLVPDEKG